MGEGKGGVPRGAAAGEEGAAFGGREKGSSSGGCRRGGGGSFWGLLQGVPEARVADNLVGAPLRGRPGGEEGAVPKGGPWGLPRSEVARKPRVADSLGAMPCGGAGGAPDRAGSPPGPL